MFLDLLKTASGKAAATAAGLIMIGGATYVLAPVSAPPSAPSPTAQVAAPLNATEAAYSAPQAAPPSTSAAAAASDVIPARFQVQVSPLGKQFICDLTVNQQQGCEQRIGDMFDDIVAIGRHAGDPGRVLIIAQSTQKQGITWAELQQGVKVGRLTIKALPLG